MHFLEYKLLKCTFYSWLILFSTFVSQFQQGFCSLFCLRANELIHVYEQNCDVISKRKPQSCIGLCTKISHTSTDFAGINLLFFRWFIVQVNSNQWSFTPSSKMFTVSKLLVHNLNRKTYTMSLIFSGRHHNNSALSCLEKYRWF